MPYDEQLARRVRPFMAYRAGFSEKRMFGGLAYFLHGNLCVAVWNDSLIARVGLEAYDATLREAHVTPFCPTGRPMRGWVLVALEGLDGLPPVRQWVERAAAFVETLPPKE